ncbi:hypothetical protein BV133_68 [Blastochloris viridis]|nr:hypothetical protein BV133_68 [Blastochloris viridis]
MTGMSALAARLKPLRRHLSIAHHVSGRIRLRLAVGGLALFTPTLARKLADAATATVGVRSFRVNPAALSVVIEYTPSVLAPELWSQLIDASDAEFDRVIGHGVIPPADANSGGSHVER